MLILSEVDEPLVAVKPSTSNEDKYPLAFSTTVPEELLDAKLFPTPLIVS